MCICVCVCVPVYMQACVGTATIYKHIWLHHYLGEQWSQTWGSYKAPQVPPAVYGVQSEFSDGTQGRRDLTPDFLNQNLSGGQAVTLSFSKVPQIISVDVAEVLCVTLRRRSRWGKQQRRPRRKAAARGAQPSRERGSGSVRAERSFL